MSHKNSSDGSELLIFSIHQIYRAAFHEGFDIANGVSPALCLPEAMQIAVLIYCLYLVSCLQCKAGLGRLARSKLLYLYAVLCLEDYELDEMLGKHGVLY